MNAASGKRVAQQTYIHVSGVGDDERWEILQSSMILAGIRLGDQFNVVRFDHQPRGRSGADATRTIA